MNQAEQELALALWTIGAIKDRRQSEDGKGFGNPPAPLWINIRAPVQPMRGTLEERLLDWMATILLQTAHKRNLQYDHVAGIPGSGSQLAEAFVRQLCIPKVHNIRLRKFVSPSADYIECPAEQISNLAGRVLLINDVLTSAAFELDAREALTDAGFTVRDVLVLVDQERGGGHALRANDCLLASVFTVRELFALYRERDQIPEEIHLEIVQYLDESP